MLKKQQKNLKLSERPTQCSRTNKNVLLMTDTDFRDPSSSNSIKDIVIWISGDLRASIMNSSAVVVVLVEEAVEALVLGTSHLREQRIYSKRYSGRNSVEEEVFRNNKTNPNNNIHPSSNKVVISEWGAWECKALEASEMMTTLAMTSWGAWASAVIWEWAASAIWEWGIWEEVICSRNRCRCRWVVDQVG